MALRFRVKDEEENKSYQVEEIGTSDDFEEEENFEEVTDDGDEALTPDEIIALKKLASVADKLAALVADSDEDESVEDDDEEEDPEPLADDDEEIDETEEEEEIVDTDEEELPTHDSKKRARDSKRSFGAIERRHNVDDSADTKQASIAKAWAERYGGKN